MGVALVKFFFPRFNEYVCYEEPNTSEGSIVSYDAEFMLDFGWMFSIPGSILTLRVLTIMFYSSIFTIVLAFISCEMHPDWDVCIPVPTGWENLTVSTVSGFVTIIFISQLIKRWWDIRILMQGVFGKGNSIIMTLASALSLSLANAPDDVVEDARRAQQQIYRFLCLAHALMYRTCNKKTDLSDLKDRGIATQQEIDFLYTLKPFNPNFVYGWISILLQRFARNGLLGDMLGEGAVNLEVLMLDLELIRANNSMVVVYIHTQLPYSFVQVVAVVVYVFVFQAVMVTAGIIGLGIRTKDSSLVFSGYFTLLLMTFVFVGLMNLYRLLADPLGEDAADYPTKTFMKTTEAGYKNLMLGIHDMSMPEDYPPGKISFRENDIKSYSNKIRAVKEDKFKRKIMKSLSTDGLLDPLFTMHDGDSAAATENNVI